MRLIDADALKENANDADYMPTGNGGKWQYIEVRDYPVGYNLAKCTRCNWSLRSKPGERWILTAEEVATSFNYCPNCGATMQKIDKKELE